MGQPLYPAQSPHCSLQVFQRIPAVSILRHRGGRKTLRLILSNIRHSDDIRNSLIHAFDTSMLNRLSTQHYLIRLPSKAGSAWKRADSNAKITKGQWRPAASCFERSGNIW